MSSPRTRGPIRHVACFERRCSTTFSQSLMPVVMGPRVRGDDAYRGTCAHNNSHQLQFSKSQFPNTLPHSRDAMRPSHTCSFRPKRAWGMPGARCTRSLVCKGWWSTRASSPQVHREHPAFPHAMVLTVSFALSPVIGLFCHRRFTEMHSAKLDASVEASGPHDFAVRTPAPSSEAPPTSTASRPASVTIAIRPCSGTRRRGYRSDLGRIGTEIFLRRGLDRKFSVLPVGRSNSPSGNRS
jgi:hypothetical protein